LIRSKPLCKGIDAMSQATPSAPGDSKLASDQPAITCLKRGKISELAVLVQKYQVEAVHAALLIVRDQDMAEDIVQNAFLQAYRKIDQFDDRRPFGPWFLRIVINAGLKAANQQKRMMPLEEPESGNLEAEWLIDPSLGPETIAETAEMREMVWRAMAQLTPDQRAAVVLHYFLDENEQEMIQQLNRPRTTVKWWLHAARQRLRKLLQPMRTSEIERPEPFDQEMGHQEMANRRWKDE
jgi:RNA polymerase sigma-70 factor, ECF subfamily